MSLAEEIAGEGPGLRRFARTLTRNRDDADDLVQTTFVCALERSHQFQPETNLKGWLTRIMWTKFLDQKRSFQKRVFATDDITALDRPVPPRQENLVHLREVGERLDLLSPVLRESLLHAAVGETYPETALSLGVPVPTVGSRLCRARIALEALQ